MDVATGVFSAVWQTETCDNVIPCTFNSTQWMSTLSHNHLLFNGHSCHITIHALTMFSAYYRPNPFLGTHHAQGFEHGNIVPV